MDVDPEIADFEAVFEEHYAAIHAYLRRRVGVVDADDLAAETFVRAYQRRASFEGARGNVAPWLFGIASNLLQHHWRRERRQLRAYARTGVDPLALPDSDASDDRLDAQRSGPAIARALAALPGVERDVLALHVWADLSHAEIAAALGVAEGTIRSRLYRARKRMREQLGDIGKWQTRHQPESEGRRNG
jgi:RNA polymerase sigma-70 factor (ECF subfamily)